jgi:hypothetical protein
MKPRTAVAIAFCVPIVAVRSPTSVWMPPTRARASPRELATRLAVWRICSRRVPDVLGGLRRVLGEGLDLLRHHREAPAGVPGARRLDGRVQGQQVGLPGDRVDRPDQLADVGRERVELLGDTRRAVDLIQGLPRRS